MANSPFGDPSQQAPGAPQQPQAGSDAGTPTTGAPADPKKLKQLEIAARRLTVGQLYLARIGQESIAAQVGVDQSQISRDIAWLKKKWLKEAAADVGEYLARELAELDEMERQAALAFGKKGGGHPRWLEVRLKIKERKAAILGLDKSIIELRGSHDHPLELNIDDVRKKRWEQSQPALRDALGALGDVQPAEAEVKKPDTEAE